MVSGGLEAINLAGDSSDAAKLNAAKLLSIEQWGDIEWTTMNQAFRRAINMMYNASDAPDLSGVKDMTFMFSRTSAFNGDLSSWNVSSVTTMTRMFQNTSVFNGNISNWDVSSVTNMPNMFLNAAAFNGDLSRWDVSSVTNMNRMFYNADSFNGDLSSWDVSSVTNMPYMFSNANSFNGNISSWNVSSVNYMSGMFFNAYSFNGDLSRWDVSSVTNMPNMFYDARSFNGNISSWNVSSVNYMSGMFFNAYSFNGDLSSWDVSSAINMGRMFDGATLFDQNLGNWYVVPADTTYDNFEGTLNVTTISAQNAFLDDDDHSPSYAIGSGGNSTLFYIIDSNTLKFKSAQSAGIYNVNVTVSGSDVFGNDNTWRLLEIEVTGQTTGTTPPVTVPGDLVENHFVTTWRTTSPNESITIPATGSYTVKWSNDIASESATDSTSHEYPSPGTYTVRIYGGLEAIDLSGDSSNAAKLQSIEQWGNAEWTTMKSAFSGASDMVYNADDAPDLSGVTDMTGMFDGASAFNGNISGWGVSSVTDMTDMFSGASAFNGNISGWGVSSVTDMTDMFSGASDFNQPLSSWDVSSVTDMTGMFYDTSDFNGNLSGWDVSSVTNMSYMFSSATSFNRTLSGWDVSSVTNMSYMFSSATSFNQTLSSWDVSSVTDMTDMFSGASDFNQPLSSWDVSSVTDMSGMFAKASSFNQTLSSWDVSSVTGMSGMFAAASDFNGNLSSWDVSSVADMYGMFDGASSFNQPLSSWDVSSVDEMSDMFYDASSFQQNLGNWYVVPADTTYATSEGTLNVTTISAQNAFLDNPSPSYAIGSGGNSTLFNITDSKTLMFKSTPSADTYNVNVTASGTNVFESGNHWRLLEIEVTGQIPDMTAPVITVSGLNPASVPVLDTYSDEGATCVDGVGVDLAVTPVSNVDTAVPGIYTVTYSCTDSASNEVTATRMVTVTGDPVKDHFVTTWRTISVNESITIPATGSYTVKWSNDIASESATDSTSHEYPSPGTYTVRIYGGLEAIDLSGDSSNAAKLQSIEQWGNAEWTTMKSAFSGASDMVYNADDAPDLSGVTDMTGMFYGASDFNGNISGWGVSSVTDMTDMFATYRGGASPLPPPSTNLSPAGTSPLSPT